MLSLRIPRERWDPRWACLLVVDVQNDFCSSDGAAARRGDDVGAAQAMVPRLLRFIERARRAGVPIMYVRTTHSPRTDTPPWLLRRSQQGMSRTCREGTWGAELYEGIAPAPGEPIVIKHRYSAFVRTDLDTILRARGTESLLVSGVTTNVCVETTARDAYMLDYYVTLVEDCSAAYSPAAHSGTLENIRNHFGLVASSDEIASTWPDGA
jgi:ureidoacrylate peracid hydrolase